MLLGLRFFFGAALACLLIVGLAFALIATARVAHNTQVSLVIPTPPAPSEFVGPEQRQTSGTGGPFVAPVIVVVPNDNLSVPAALRPGNNVTVDPKDGDVNVTVSIPAEPPATAPDNGASPKPTQNEEPAVKEAKLEEPENSMFVFDEKVPMPLVRPVQKPAAKPRTQRARAPAEPAEIELFPFRYFRN